MKIGKYEIRIIESGSFGLDGGAMFGIIPKPLWQKTNQSDEANRVRLATRHLLLENGDRKIIIETGMGDKWDDKQRNIYAIDTSFNLLSALGRNGIKADEITDVILTHLHFDHTGGSTIINGNKLEPSFPNAKYFVQKQNFDWARNPADRDKGSYIKENFMPVFEEGVLNFIIGNAEFDNGIEFLVINGHTFGQQMVKISDSRHTFLFCSDLLPFTSHIPLPYIMGYDLQPLVTLQEKKKFLKQAVEENWKIIFGHDPETPIATVKKFGEGYIVDKQFISFEEI